MIIARAMILPNTVRLSAYRAGIMVVDSEKSGLEFLSLSAGTAVEIVGWSRADFAPPYAPQDGGRRAAVLTGLSGGRQ